VELQKRARHSGVQFPPIFPLACLPVGGTPREIEVLLALPKSSILFGSDVASFGTSQKHEPAVSLRADDKIETFHSAPTRIDKLSLGELVLSG
jgi:hypothetical protein